jgi:ribonuclease HII
MQWPVCREIPPRNRHSTATRRLREAVVTCPQEGSGQVRAACFSKAHGSKIAAMSLLIGLDEAGYGPNLGPLVVVATLWNVPGDPRRCDLWSVYSQVVSSEADAAGKRLHLADSKSVHSASAGIAAIEHSATAILNLAGQPCESLFALWDEMCGRQSRLSCGEPWFCCDDLPLPIAEHPVGAFQIVDRWADCCATTQCRLVGVACDIVPARRFNEGVRTADNKALVLSETTLRLLKRIWNPSEPALVLCDKHGGRDRYADLLADTFPEQMPLRLEESRSMSRYRLGRGEVRFQVRSEEHLPVAAASIVAKYLREACMEAFNRFWSVRRPELRPTKGYPTDARRFLEAIEADAAALGLDRETYWRCR